LVITTSTRMTMSNKRRKKDGRENDHRETEVRIIIKIDLLSGTQRITALTSVEPLVKAGKVFETGFIQASWS
jgi:hypothetical protein